MTQQEIYSQLMFIINSLEEKEDFLFEGYDIDAENGIIEDFYKYLRQSKYINETQNLEFKILEKFDRMNEICFSDAVGIISNRFPPEDDDIDSDVGTLNEEQTYAVIAGFFAENDRYYELFIDEIRDEWSESGLKTDYLLSIAPNVPLPEIEVDNAVFEMTSKTCNILNDGIETIQTILEENISDEDIVLIRKILMNMKEAINSAS